MFIYSRKKAKTVIHLSNISNPQIYFHGMNRMCIHRKYEPGSRSFCGSIKLRNLGKADLKVVPYLRTYSSWVLLKAVATIWSITLSSASPSSHNPATFAGTSDFSLLRQKTLIWHKHSLTANVSCIACHSCFTLGGTQGKYFRGIFSSQSFENVRFQFFFLFLKSPNRDTDQLACPRQEEEYLVGYCLGKKKQNVPLFEIAPCLESLLWLKQ